ncbi:MAG TPA: TetR/AcrR family transcriptional regulator [Opitutus sp.]|nr:TetR/AcrR family transcriptional regulator [Opitutus sp.]
MSAKSAEANPPSSKRDQLMTTAWNLFYRDGFRAVGIDTLLAAAGVAKMTLYNHFPSKDDLIIAVLERRSDGLVAAVDAAIAAAGRTPSRQLAAVFDGLKAWFSADEFKGCAFIRALSEYPDPTHPIHQAAWRHKRAMNARIRAIAEAADARQPAALADTISLLIDGAIIAAHATSTNAPADSARAAALNLLKLATA